MTGAANETLTPYRKQGFGQTLEPIPPYGLLIVDFVNGFADPEMFGGGNIRPAIERTESLLAHARRAGWPVAHSRIVYADDDSDANIFSAKVPNLLKLKEASPASQIVDELTPVAGEMVVRKTVPSAFFGTMLAPWLAQRGVISLFVAGAVTSGCVRASVVDAMSHGFRPIVVSNCVGDRALEPHNANLFDMEQKNACLLTLSEALELPVSATTAVA
ncbi:isochorismatase family protein [Pacificispira sp.]|uniref:isochorismatase family protein n=1 Tax=Pacificispira sp. TaxID=2888761 RepID=UPI003B522AB4